jgi:hypothetical protein
MWFAVYNRFNVSIPISDFFDEICQRAIYPFPFSVKEKLRRKYILWNNDAGLTSPTLKAPGVIGL